MVCNFFDKKTGSTAIATSRERERVVANDV